MAMISFWAAKYSNIVVCFWFVCLFVFLCLTRAFHRREKFVLVLFFRKKEISIFTTSHIKFYLAIYNLWLLLIMGFGPVGGRGGGQGGYTRGQQVGVGVSPSIRARAKVVRQHWQGKSIQICSFFRRIMGVAMASGLTQWAEWASGLSHAPSKLWRHCAMQRYQRPFLFSFFDFLFSSINAFCLFTWHNVSSTIWLFCRVLRDSECIEMQCCPPKDPLGCSRLEGSRLRAELLRRSMRGSSCL